MSADAFFDAARVLKRELTGDGLTQQEVDAFNAIIAGWLPRKVAPNPTALADAQAFFKAVREKFGALSQEQVEGFNSLLQEMGVASWPIAWAAYGLATAYHETAKTMQPVPEAYWLSPEKRRAYYRRMYDIQGERPQKARELGNTTPGDGERYPGQGYVQLTGKGNYLKAGTALGVDLVGHPELALKPDIAARVMVKGMAGGWFTGKSCRDYLPPAGHADQAAYTQARRIINGQDKAVEIARLAENFEAALTAGGWA